MRLSVAIDDFPEMLLGNVQIFQKLFEPAARKLAVEAAHQRHGFLARDVIIAHFVGRIRSAAADAEFDEGEIVMKAVQLIIQAGILGIGAFRTTLRIRLKAGMFGTTKFGLKSGKYLTVPIESLVTVQGQNYVFVKKSTLEFERRKVTIGQQANNHIIVFDGIAEHEEVVIKGTMQLKGLSFGY